MKPPPPNPDGSCPACCARTGWRCPYHTREAIARDRARWKARELAEKLAAEIGRAVSRL